MAVVITTDFIALDPSLSTIEVNFKGGVLIAADGTVYQSISGTYSLTDATFSQSYYQAFALDFTLSA